MLEATTTVAMAATAISARRAVKADASVSDMGFQLRQCAVPREGVSGGRALKTPKGGALGRLQRSAFEQDPARPYGTAPTDAGSGGLGEAALDLGPQDAGLRRQIALGSL